MGVSFLSAHRNQPGAVRRAGWWCSTWSVSRPFFIGMSSTAQQASAPRSARLQAVPARGGRGLIENITRFKTPETGTKAGARARASS